MKTTARQYRNQRLTRAPQRRQQHLLEVSIRADKERSRRLRQAIGLVFKVVLVAALLVGAWVGTSRAVKRFFWENPLFFLTDVRAAPGATLTREQILTTAGIVEGGNIFNVDLEKARIALAQLPQVSHVEVQRILPHRIDLEVTERQPVAWITEAGDIDPTASDRALLIDAQGFVMKSRKVLPEYLHLPVISGAVLENLAPGQKVREPELLAALELLRVSDDCPRWQVRSIDVSRGFILVARGMDRAPFLFGLDHVDRQWERLLSIFDYAAEHHQEVRTANLFIERNTPAELYDPATPEPEVPVPPGPPAGGKTPAAGGLKSAPASAKAASAKPEPKTRAEGKGKTSPKTEPAKADRFQGPASVRKPFHTHG